MIFDQIGPLALGSRLRMLNERFSNDGKMIYEMYGVDLKPKWFPVFYLLSQHKEKSITAIASEIGHSHPSVVRIVKEMVKAGVAVERKDKSDGRRNLVGLSKKGREEEVKIQDQYTDIAKAMEEALAQTQHNIWKAMEEMEYLLDQKSLFHRVREQKKIRESQKVRIVPYEAKYRKAFQELNEEWINKYFTLEEEDRRILYDPENYIYGRGGCIVVALYEEEPVGVCALVPMEDPDYDFELGKMAVGPKAQGKGIGWLLGKAIVEEARSKGARNIYLESNTVLGPAIRLYEKLGFQKVCGHASPYSRCNIQMELKLGSQQDH